MELLNKTTFTDTHVYSFFSLFQMNANKSHLRFFLYVLKAQRYKVQDIGTNTNLKCMEERACMLLHYTVS